MILRRELLQRHRLIKYINKFKENNGSYICRELKGVETKKVLCTCDKCILDAVALTEEYLNSKKEAQD